MSTLVVNLDQRIKTNPRYTHSTVTEYFANSKLDWWNPTNKYYAQQTNIIENWLEKISPKDILELGAGFGRISQLLDKLPRVNLTLVDINKKALNILKQEFPHRQIINSDINSFLSKKNKYDLLVAIELLVHIPNIEKLIQGVYNSLRKNGTLITSITPDSWYEANWPRKPTIHRGINEKELNDFVSKFFNIVEVNRSSNNQLITYLLKRK